MQVGPRCQKSPLWAYWRSHLLPDMEIFPYFNSKEPSICMYHAEIPPHTRRIATHRRNHSPHSKQSIYKGIKNTYTLVNPMCKINRIKYLYHLLNIILKCSRGTWKEMKQNTTNPQEIGNRLQGQPSLIHYFNSISKFRSCPWIKPSNTYIFLQGHSADENTQISSFHSAQHRWRSKTFFN